MEVRIAGQLLLNDKISLLGQAKIYNILFNGMPIETYNKIVESGNIQAFYERKKNRLRSEVFGDHRTTAIEMRRLFDRFLTVEQELKLNETSNQINQLKKSISRKRKYGHDTTKEVRKHNELVDINNELAERLKPLFDLYMCYR